MLYLVATPIGNLGDMTFRAIETLKNADYILCEDTRHSSVLLFHYGIQRPLKSYHKFNEAKSVEGILEDLKSGKNIALISDAGTPGISDPGAYLVEHCIDNEVQVISIPGPCAAIAAVTCSGLCTDLFQFIGFLPKKASELKSCLASALEYGGTTIAYESPERLVKTLIQIHELAPERRLGVARELTKKFEEIRRGKAMELIDHWQNHPLKGEIVLLISGEKKDEAEEWLKWTPEEHVHYLETTYTMTRQEAIKMAAKQRSVPKRQIYNELTRN